MDPNGGQLINEMKKSARYHPESTRHANKNPQMTARFAFACNEEESRSRELFEEDLTENLSVENKMVQPPNVKVYGTESELNSQVQVEIEDNEM